MKDRLISCLVFPVAPIAVIYLIFVLCADIWQAGFHTPGEDGGEAEPAMAMIGVPFLLVIAALLLATLTGLTRWVAGRYQPGVWWWVATGIARVALAAGALLLFLASAVFFMGDALGVFTHWQVACAWLAWALCAGAFGVQQYRRLWR